MNDKLIELKSVNKSYSEGDKDRFVLKDMDAVIREGEIVIVLGRSGSGKSTFLNLLSGIDLPDSGEIIIGGKSLQSLPEKERTLFRRNKVGFIFQFFNLIPTLTVMENLLLPLELTSQNGAGNKERVMEFLEYVGLEDRPGSYPDMLSGGEQQRVAIARALIHDPDIVLADEPTGNLDFETGRQVIGLLDKLVQKQGKTLIMATHSMELTGIADRILMLRNGVFTEQTQAGS